MTVNATYLKSTALYTLCLNAAIPHTKSRVVLLAYQGGPTNYW